jgi:nitrogen PTS system EIIA component
MKSLLDALQEGRLVELPTSDKNEVLEYLALLLEAVPDIHSDIDIVKEINEREAEGNTGLGKGIACPHIRVKRDGELLCAVGWSPEGIEYGASDGKKVHIVIMYFIPDAARAAYLKELSSLAKAVLKTAGDILFDQLSDIHSVRNKLLDWVEMSVGDALPSATARMIRLEERQAAQESTQPLAPSAKKALSIIPFTFVSFDAEPYRIFAQDSMFVDHFENSKSLSKITDSADSFEIDGYYISVMSTRFCEQKRVLRECVAVKQ